MMHELGDDRFAVLEMILKRLIAPAVVLTALLVPLAVCAKQPPIIDRDQFFGEIQISGAQISPDGKFLSFLKPFKGTRNIWVKKLSLIHISEPTRQAETSYAV